MVMTPNYIKSVASAFRDRNQSIGEANRRTRLEKYGPKVEKKKHEGPRVMSEEHRLKILASREATIAKRYKAFTDFLNAIPKKELQAIKRECGVAEYQAVFKKRYGKNISNRFLKDYLARI